MNTGIVERSHLESRFQSLTRVGFVARGLLYIIIALLIIATGRTEDLTGALDYLGRGFGRILLIGLAAGLATYGLWRLADAALGMENPGDAWKAWRKRAAAAFIGSVYLFLAYKAVRVLIAGRVAATEVERHADTVLDLPGGQIVLGLAALGLAVAGATQLYRAQCCDFLDRLDERARAPAVKWLGRIGYAARGVVFLAVAFLIARAAADNQSTEAGGMEQALDLLAYPIDYIVAAGLMLFGVFSIVEALFRRIHDPPVKRAAEKMAEKLPG